MNLAESLLLLFFTLFIVGGTAFIIYYLNTSQSNIEDKCSWTPGDCQRFCSVGNFYFDSESGFCKTWAEGLCCTNPPFETLEECQEICES